MKVWYNCYGYDFDLETRSEWIGWIFIESVFNLRFVSKMINYLFYKHAILKWNVTNVVNYI